MIDRKKLELLACPQCEGALTLYIDEQNNDAEMLICRHCQLGYVVEDGIPNLLINAARNLAEPAASEEF